MLWNRNVEADVIVEEYDINEKWKSTDLLCNTMAGSSLMLPLEASGYTAIKGISYFMVGISVDGM